MNKYSSSFLKIKETLGNSGSLQTTWKYKKKGKLDIKEKTEYMLKGTTHTGGVNEFYNRWKDLIKP